MHNRQYWNHKNHEHLQKIKLSLSMLSAGLTLLFLFQLAGVSGAQEGVLDGGKVGSGNSEPNENVPAEMRAAVEDVETSNLDEKIEQLYEKLRRDPLDEQSIREIRQLRNQRDQTQKNSWASLANALQGCLEDRAEAARRHLEQAIRSSVVVKLANSYLSVSLEEILAKCEERISQPICPECGNTHRADCSVCRGSGMDRCPKCKGRGSIRIRNEQKEMRSVFCPECLGRGEVFCDKCSG